MVGVAGRSKGCRTCRQRKKGCDLQQPICGNCSRLNITCEYDRRQVFINVTGPGKAGRTTFKPSCTDVVLPHSLARSAYEDKYISLLWDAWSPCGTPSAEISANYPVYSWVSSARDLYQDDDGLRRTLIAMSLSTLGQKGGQAYSTAKGFQTYVQALSEVNVSLQHSKRWKSDAIMVASQGLGLFELLYGTQERVQAAGSQVKSWHNHNLGELALIQQRGPKSFIEGHAHHIFSGVRMHLAIAGCMSRKRSFLSNTAWKTIPWAKISKTPKDVMLDILTDVPALLEEVDILKSNPSGYNCQRFMETYQRLDRETVWWLENLSPPTDILDGLHERNYRNPTADELAVAHVMTCFWTVCILVYSSLHAVLSSTFNLPGIEVMELAERTNPRPYCLLIADTVEVFFQPEAGTFGMHAAPFPIGMAIKYLMLTEGFSSKDCMRLIGYFSRQSGGAAMGSFLANTLFVWN
ncbi:hypothetical protein CGCSCA4_v013356 [Colletotrichum siamense]|uniref:Zn(2)-C6 fungal-type domain-containing protein n=1 Tax=Colletotrichum siamense TaxID=690259 RepID=A0A9P5BNQ2_COLSI|nr:hypothetical protein CGCSCA4_v013356 [Colletotrichum siamense]KAF4846258.1 hypothetical protein CGCSCA2_v013179 [Colletotrichum siamense]